MDTNGHKLQNTVLHGRLRNLIENDFNKFLIEISNMFVNGDIHYT